MKTRAGFVSNSSSSSFICDISGESESGYDATLEDYGYVCCVNGHTMKEDYVENLDSLLEENSEFRYELPEKHCPVCNGKARERIAKRLKSEMSRLNITLEDLK